MGDVRQLGAVLEEFRTTFVRLTEFRQKRFDGFCRKQKYTNMRNDENQAHTRTKQNAL